MVDTYTAASGYVLPWHQKELRRLNEQHKFLKRIVYDDRLIYDEGVAFGPVARILDSGTGSGIWSTELAKELPESVEIHAVDISDVNFPPSSPPNVHFSIASITDLPRNWTGQFDLINQRFLFAALKGTEWPVALSEMYRVLKPGTGTVQLAEMDLKYPISKSPAETKIQQLSLKLFQANGLMFEVGSQLPNMLREAGFVDVVEEKKYTPVGKMWGEIGRQGTASYGGALRNMGAAYIRAGLVGSEDEFSKFVDDLEREWDEMGYQYVCRIVCARKPPHQAAN